MYLAEDLDHIEAILTDDSTKLNSTSDLGEGVYSLFKVFANGQLPHDFCCAFFLLFLPFQPFQPVIHLLLHVSSH